MCQCSVFKGADYVAFIQGFISCFCGQFGFVYCLFVFGGNYRLNNSFFFQGFFIRPLFISLGCAIGIKCLAASAVFISWNQFLYGMTIAAACWISFDMCARFIIN